MSPPKLRFGWLDALVLAVVFGLIGYVVYRAQSHFHYDWDWRLIRLFHPLRRRTGRLGAEPAGPGLSGDGATGVVGWALAALIGGAMVCAGDPRSVFRLLGWTYVGLIRNIPPLVFIFIFYFSSAVSCCPCWISRTGLPGPRRDLVSAGLVVRGRWSCYRISYLG